MRFRRCATTACTSRKRRPSKGNPVRAWKFASAALLMLASASAVADASVAWLRVSELESRVLSGRALPGKVAVGSVWKLFAYADLVDVGAREPSYTCTKAVRARDEPELYCCKPGETIDRDTALARSCGAYF